MKNKKDSQRHSIKLGMRWLGWTFLDIRIWVQQIGHGVLHEFQNKRFAAPNMEFFSWFIVWFAWNCILSLSLSLWVWWKLEQSVFFRLMKKSSDLINSWLGALDWWCDWIKFLTGSIFIFFRWWHAGVCSLNHHTKEWNAVLIYPPACMSTEAIMQRKLEINIVITLGDCGIWR